jgi:hypothetical protein
MRCNGWSGGWSRRSATGRTRVSACRRVSSQIVDCLVGVDVISFMALEVEKLTPALLGAHASFSGLPPETIQARSAWVLRASGRRAVPQRGCSHLRGINHPECPSPNVQTAVSGLPPESVPLFTLFVLVLVVVLVPLVVKTSTTATITIEGKGNDYASEVDLGRKCRTHFG